MSRCRLPKLLHPQPAPAKFGCLWVIALALCFLVYLIPGAQARSAATPWTSDLSLQNLVLWASSSSDVVEVVGFPDHVVKQEQMYPVIENFYYYDDKGAATVFVFENNLLAGMLYKSPSDQYVDISYFLPNNGDRLLNLPSLAGYPTYVPNLPLYMF